MTEKEFQEIIKERINSVPKYDFQKSIEKDLTVRFDWENFDYSTKTLNGVTRRKRWWGIKSIYYFPFLCCYAGGDWEYPVFFIIYLDGKNKIRAYVPRDGNVYDEETNQAYSNDSKSINDLDYDFNAIRRDIIKHFSISESVNEDMGW